MSDYRTARCFRCRAELDSETNTKCRQCGWLECHECGACGCDRGREDWS